MIYIGMDNGVTGSIGIINGDRISYISTPIKHELNYQKSKKKFLNRVDYHALYGYLLPYSDKTCKVGLERPMVDPRRFDQTCSAVRAHESTLIIFENLKLPFEYIDSKGWQKELLPPVNGPELKKASTQIGIRMFPHLEKQIKERGDADGILIAEYLRRR